MELTDISRRIFAQHWQLIVCCVVIAVAAVVLIVPRAHTYTASARLAMDAQDPQTTVETMGISDTVKAIATSPSEVAAAMLDAGVRHRNPVAVASTVTTTSLGQSTLVDLSVSDRDRHVAAALANALAAEVIRTRLAVTRGNASRAIAQLDQQIASLNHVRQSNVVSQTLASLESQRLSLVSTSATSRTPSIISPATAPPTSDPSGLKTDLILGAFIGLIIGIGIASVIETVRPKLIGSDAVASELDAPLLGTLATDPSDASPDELESLALRVRLAGKAAGLPNIRLVPVHEGTDLGTFARLLDETWSKSGADGDEVRAPSRALQALTVARERGASTAPSLEEAPFPIRPFDPESVLMNGARIGIVVVSPDRVAKSELAAAMQLLRVAPGGVLGVVTFRQADGQRGRLKFKQHLVGVSTDA